jgi:hypothetical protein
MAYGADHAVLLDRLDEELRVASDLAPNLFSKVIASARTRLPTLNKSGKAARVDRLIEAGAWTDAVFALIDLELPACKLRRLVYENGEWFCSLSQQPNLPVTLDDTADGRHEVMRLAILLAFLEARRRMSLAARLVATAVLTVDRAPAALICCDNFA